MRYVSMVFFFLSFSSIAQTDTVVITSRKDVPLQAVLDIETSEVLYAGQEYVFRVTASGDYDLRLTVKNAIVQLSEESKRNTGGLTYTLTPIDTGECMIGISNQINETRTVGLKTQFFKVINYPVPPLKIGRVRSGEIINSLLNDSTEIICSYPDKTGVYDEYEVESWTVKIGDKGFSGTGSLLTKELIQCLNHTDNEFLLLEVILEQNKTGHLKSEGVYLIRKSTEH